MRDMGHTLRRAALVIAIAAMPAATLHAQAGTTTGGQTTSTATGTGTYDDRDDRDGGFPWGLLGLLGLAGLMGRKRDDRTVHVPDDRPVGDRGTTGRV